MIVTTSIEIDAAAEQAWEILIDFPSYGEWNPLTPRVEGDVVVDAVLTLHAVLGGSRMVRKHVVSRVDPPTALCWTIRTRKPWLMRGERCQSLEDLGEGRCRYANEERVHGLLSWVVALFFKGRIRHSLEAMGEALKGRAENC